MVCGRRRRNGRAGGRGGCAGMETLWPEDECGEKEREREMGGRGGRKKERPTIRWVWMHVWLASRQGTGRRIEIGRVKSASRGTEPSDVTASVQHRVRSIAQRTRRRRERRERRGRRVSLADVVHHPVLAVRRLPAATDSETSRCGHTLINDADHSEKTRLQFGADKHATSAVPRLSLSLQAMHPSVRKQKTRTLTTRRAPGALSRQHLKHAVVGWWQLSFVRLFVHRA